MDTIKIEQLVQHGQYHAAMEYLTNTGTLDPEKKLLRIRILERLGKFNDALHEVDKLLNTQNLDNLHLYGAIVSKASLLEYLGRDSEALELLQFRPEFDKGTNYKWAHIKARAKNIHAFILGNNGHTEEAMVLYQKSYDEYLKINNLEGMADVLNNQALLLRKTGDINKGLEKLQRSISLRSKLGNRYRLANGIGNLGMFYKDQSRLDLAEKTYKKAWKIFEQIDNYLDQGICLMNMGIIEVERRNYENALSNFRKGLSLFLQSNNYSHVGDIFYHLIRTYIKLNDLEEANKNIEMFEHIIQENKTVENQLYYNLSRGLYHLKKNTAKDIHLSQLYLDKIISDEITHYELSVLARMKKIETLLIEYKLTHSDEVLEEISDLTGSIKDMTNLDGSPSTLNVQIIILESKIHFIRGNMNRAIELIEDAKIKVSTLHNDQLTYQIEEHVRFYQDEIEKINNIVKSADSIIRKMEETRLLDYIDEISEIIDT